MISGYSLVGTHHVHCSSVFYLTKNKEWQTKAGLGQGKKLDKNMAKASEEVCIFAIILSQPCTGQKLAAAEGVDMSLTACHLQDRKLSSSRGEKTVILGVLKVRWLGIMPLLRNSRGGLRQGLVSMLSSSCAGKLPSWDCMCH